MKKLLLLVDIQNDYFPGGAMELVGSPAAGSNAERLLSTFRRKGLPIVHIQHLFTQNEATFFLPDTIGAEINSCVAPEAGEVVFQKNFPNSFRETPLLDYLLDLEVTHLVIAGMMTHMCIDATTRAAVDLGFECVLANDACATLNLSFGEVIVPAEQVQAAFLAAISSLYAKVLPVEEICANL
jgi:nicotinamidase-related amidase